MSDLIDNVQLGVLFLDDTQPGWEDRIDVLKLDINEYDSCVLGQVFANDESDETGFMPLAMERFRLATYRLHDWAEHMGLDTDGIVIRAGFNVDMFTPAEPLTRAWVEVLGR